MQWDLGPVGLGLLVVMALAFGGVTQLVLGRLTGRRTWLVAAAAYLVAGLLVSEAWFGWATGEELQPNVDGLSFDEVLLITTLPGLAVVFLLRHRLRRRRTGATTGGDDRAPAGRR